MATVLVGSTVGPRWGHDGATMGPVSDPTVEPQGRDVFLPVYWKFKFNRYWKFKFHRQ